MMVLLRFNIYNELHVTFHLRILGGGVGTLLKKSRHYQVLALKVNL